MSVLFYPESIRILGSDANGNNVMLCEMAVDDIANLPAANAFINDGYVLSMGCVATVINDNSKHRLNGSGNWVQIAAGTSTYTMAEIDAMITAIDAENANQQNEINYAVNAGAKNFLEITAQTQTINDVTFTVNADQTITVNGTNNTQGAITYTVVSHDRSIEITDGEYILTGCPQGGGSSTYDLRWYQYSSGKSAYDNGFGATVDKNGNTSSSNIAIVIRAGVTASNIIFRPMLRPAAITDAVYAPYAPSNRQLYEMILQLQGG